MLLILATLQLASQSIMTKPSLLSSTKYLPTNSLSYSSKSNGRFVNKTIKSTSLMLASSWELKFCQNDNGNIIYNNFHKVRITESKSSKLRDKSRNLYFNLITVAYSSCFVTTGARFLDILRSIN